MVRRSRIETSALFSHEAPHGKGTPASLAQFIHAFSLEASRDLVSMIGHLSTYTHSLSPNVSAWNSLGSAVSDIDWGLLTWLLRGN